jgi:hypothetical protein
MYDGQTYEVMFVTQYKERQAIPDCALRGKGCTLFLSLTLAKKFTASVILTDSETSKTSSVFLLLGMLRSCSGANDALASYPFVCLSLRGCSTPKTPPVPRITVPLLANFSAKQFSSSVARSQPFQKLFAQN